MVKIGTRSDQQVGEKSGQSKGFRKNQLITNLSDIDLILLIYFSGNHMQKNNNQMDEDLKKMLASVDIHDLKYITVNDLKWVISIDS